MRPDIVPGALFPDHELSDHRGKHRTLSELQGGDPLVLERCRPDWNIESASQRAAWAGGDKAGFHPYGKTQAQLLAEQD